MNTLTEAIRKHHLSLAKTLKTHARAAGAGPHSEDDSFAAFLKGDLLPHARGEERHLYGVVDTLVREHGRPTATMLVDHEFIKDYTARIEAAGKRLGSASEAERPKLAQELRELALRLEAIVELHLAKEERVYLPLIEQHLDEQRQRALLSAIHEDAHHGAQTPPPDGRPLDVREIIPRQRHTLIFDTYAALKPGEAFVLINDHDPRPLYYQFAAEHAGEFSWDYLEQGPEVWRVRIGRPN